MPPVTAPSPRARRPRRRAALAIGAAAAGLAACSSAAAAPGLLPDLVADRPEGIITTREVVDGSPGTRLLLRFDGHVHNAGPGRLEIVGRAPAGSWDAGTLRMTDVRQRVYDASGALVSELPSRAHVPHAGSAAPARHQHWHVDRAAAYHLVTAPGGAHVKESAKVGFCLADSQPIEAPEGTPPRYSSGACNGRDADGGWIADPALTPLADHVETGISPGFRDTYLARYWTQWIDLTGEVAPGAYRIMAVADPTDVIVEANEVNPPEVSSEVRLRGWLAEPASVAVAAGGGPRRIELAARKVVGAGLPAGDALSGEPAPPVFAIADPPAHGTAIVSGATATYTPDPGYAGPDAFRVTAAEPGTLLARPPATIAVRVAAPAVPLVAATPSVQPPAAWPATRRRPALRGLLRVRGRTAVVHVRARRAGRVGMTLRHRGRLVARCVARVRGGGRAACRARLPGRPVAGRLVATAVLVRAGRVVARSRVAWRPPDQARRAKR